MTLRQGDTGVVGEWPIPVEDLNITPTQITDRIGYGRTSIPDFIHDAIGRVFPGIPGFGAIECGFRLFPASSVSITRTYLEVDGTGFEIGPVISRGLRGSDSIALFAATAGGKLEAWAQRVLVSGDPIEAYVIDTAASEIVERAADWLQDRLLLTAGERNLKISNRYSPGYCGWPVSEQHKLFSLLPPSFCGITLNPSALMTPVKSVSGIIGLGSDADKHDYECFICEQEDCIHRIESTES